jgi:hypothetical protein
MKKVFMKSELINNIQYLLLIFLFFFVVGRPASAQGARETKPPLKDRIFIGGSFGLQFGTVTNIDINPIVGLWVLPRLSIAAGPGFQYYSDSYSHMNTSIYSFKTYAQFVVIKDINNILPIGLHTGIVFHAEDEALNLDSEYWRNVTTQPNRFWVNSVLLGGGLSQQIGRKGSFDILILWVIGNNTYNYYSNPEIRIGFSF